MKKGQGLVEYALLLALVALVVLGGLRLTGTSVSDVINQVASAFGVDTSSPVERITGDFLSRIQAFYEENGRYPRSWGDYRFTDIGLDPDDWGDTVEGILWNPNGDKIGLTNQIGDDIQVYVDDLDGNQKHLYDGYNIWCTPSGPCYYHSVAPENEIDISTLEIVQ
jgi:Flp pilus assembly pilin Flp